MRAISLFSSIGLAETYLEELGIDIVLANEIDKKRADLYQHLYPKTEMICDNICEDKVTKEIVSKHKNIDILIATPPCQGMSIAGNMSKLDSRNQLISYAVKIIKKIKPKFVFLENVPRQLKTKIEINNKVILIPEYLENELSKEYNINEEKIARSMDYGIPQMRSRNIFLLARKDTNIHWRFPIKEKKIVTLKEALKNVPSIDPYLREGYTETLKMFPDFDKKKHIGLKYSKWHYPPTHAKRHVQWMQKTPSGKTAFDNLIFFPQKSNGDRIVGHYNHYRRHSWEKPSRSITQNNGVISSLACVHPGHLIKKGNEKARIYSDPRCFSIYELMIVSSLPKNWNIPTKTSEILIRKGLGEGIPPLLVKKIFKELIKNIKKN